MNAAATPSPAVSVLVSTYRTGAYLIELCASLAAQTRPDFEALILSDGGDDHLQPGLERFRADPRFGISAWTPNQGVGCGIARLMGGMRSPFWCNPGADDLFHPRFLERRLDAMARVPEAAVVFGPCVEIDGRGREAWYHPARIRAERLAEFDGKVINPRRMLNLLLQDNVVNCPSVLCRTKETIPVLLAQPIHWRYSPDYHYWITLAARGAGFYYDRAVVHSYRMHPTQLSRSRESEALRLAEFRLVPLMALARERASEYGGACWRLWGRDLYALWLWRTLSLIKRGCLDWRWQAQAGEAFHGQSCSRVGYIRDLLCFMPRMTRLRRSEAKLAARQIWVNGLRKVDDPLFRRPGGPNLPEFAR